MSQCWLATKKPLTQMQTVNCGAELDPDWCVYLTYYLLSGCLESCGLWLAPSVALITFSGLAFVQLARGRHRDGTSVSTQPGWMTERSGLDSVGWNFWGNVIELLNCLELTAGLVIFLKSRTTCFIHLSIGLMALKIKLFDPIVRKCW